MKLKPYVVHRRQVRLTIVSRLTLLNVALGSEFKSHRLFSVSVVFSKRQVQKALTLVLYMPISSAQTENPIPLIDLTTNDTPSFTSESTAQRAYATPLGKNDIILIMFSIRRVTQPAFSSVETFGALREFQWLRWKTFFEAEQIQLLYRV